MNPKRPLRVLQVISVLSVGGAESWLLALLRHWSQTGAAELDFLLTGGKPSFYDKDVEALGSKIHYVTIWSREYRRFHSRIPPHLARRRVRCDSRSF